MRRAASGAAARRPARPRSGAPASRPGERTSSRARATRPEGGADTPSADAAETRPARLVRLLSVRALVLGVVVLTGFSLLLPTVRAYFGQQAELDALAVEVAEAERQEAELAAELDRWDDEAYVAAQARERLGYVLPGETAYRVVDPEVVQDEVVEGAAPGTSDGPTLPLGSDVNPWYATVWDSVRIAGEAELGEPAPGGEPTKEDG